MGFEFNDKFPIYIQIMDDIKLQIINGKLKTNDQVDSVRTMASTYGVNPNTIQKALVELENEGLMKSERTAGRFISVTSESIKLLKLEIAKGYIKRFVEQMDKLGYSKEEIIKFIGEEKYGE